MRSALTPRKRILNKSCYIDSFVGSFRKVAHEILVLIAFAYVVMLPINSFHIVSARAPNSLVPRYLREITLEGATFIRLPMHYTMEYENRRKEK